MEGLLIRRKEALAILGITRHTFYELVDAGLITPRVVRLKSGRTVGKPLYVRTEVEAVVERLKLET